MQNAGRIRTIAGKTMRIANSVQPIAGRSRTVNTSPCSITIGMLGHLYGKRSPKSRHVVYFHIKKVYSLGFEYTLDCPIYNSFKISSTKSHSSSVSIGSKSSIDPSDPGTYWAAKISRSSIGSSETAT